MRKIETQMSLAVRAGENFKSGNTQVLHTGALVEVYLHGNLIARQDRYDANCPQMRGTLAGWDTPTTKSRLRALGANLTTKAGRTYANGKEIASSDWFDI